MANAFDIKQTDSEKSTALLDTGASQAWGSLDGSNWTVNLAGRGATLAAATTAGNAARIPTWVWITAAAGAAWWLWKRKG